MMFRHQTVADDIVSVHLKARLTGVSSALNASLDIMVSAPQPRVVDDYITTVDLHHVLCRNASLIGTTDASKNVMRSARVRTGSLESSTAPQEKRLRVVTTSLE